MPSPVALLTVPSAMAPRPPAAVGQFRELVETAERNKALRETLKQVGMRRCATASLPRPVSRLPVLLYEGKAAHVACFAGSSRPCLGCCCADRSCAAVPPCWETLLAPACFAARLHSSRLHCRHAPAGAAPDQGLGHCSRPCAQSGGDGCAAARVPPRCAQVAAAATPALVAAAAAPSL